MISFTSLIQALSLITTVSAFSVPVTNEHVRRNGGGVPVIPAGKNSLFDPNVAGKLGDTNECLDRIQKGIEFQYEYLSDSPVEVAVVPPEADLSEAQHWLEDIGLPLNFAKPQAPVTATLLGRQRIISDDAPGDIQHIVMALPEGMHYVEGQSISIIPPGVTDKGKPHKPRLYSIASTRYGDLLNGNTVSLCVRRAQFFDPVTGAVDPAKEGICSNFLCNAPPHTPVQIAGPIGKTMLLPEDPDTDIIMVATGTGVAPFRGFLHRLFMENTVARHMFNAKAWLILGVPVTGGLLYADEFEAMKANVAEAQTTSGGGAAAAAELEVTYAISREMKNAQGGKYYVQDVLAERADELFMRLENGAHIYFCGLKGMMPGILDSLEQVAESRGVVWSEKLKELKANGQWHVEVY